MRVAIDDIPYLAFHAVRAYDDVGGERGSIRELEDRATTFICHYIRYGCTKRDIRAC